MHLLGRRHPHDGKAVADNLPDCGSQFQSRRSDFRFIFNQEAARRIVVALIPQGMEGSGQVAKVESDAHAGCAAGCAKKGAALVFVSGGKVYKVDDQAKVQDHAGHKVTITGKVEGDTLKIDSVKM